MNKFSRALIAIFVMAALSQGCGLIPVAERVLAPGILFVSTSGDDANDCLSEAAACLTLRAALTKTTLNSTINIGPGDYYVTEDPATPARSGRSLYELINGVTLVGAGREQTIFHSAHGAYTFEAGSSIPVVIRNLGIDASNGAIGGINVHGRADITIENCRLYNGRLGILVQGNGLARITNSLIEIQQTGIQILGGHVTIDNDSLVSNNELGVHIQRNGVVAINHSTIAGNNTGVHNEGNALINDGTVIEENNIGILNNGGFLGGSLSILETTLRRNTESAIVNDENGQVVISNSTVDNNGYLGGPELAASSSIAIVNHGQMTIHGGVISNNRGKALVNDVPSIFRNHVDGTPYIPSDERPDLSISEVRIFLNQSYDRQVCAIQNVRGRTNIESSNIYENNCRGVDAYGGRVDISKSSFVGNYTGLYARGDSQVALKNTTISGSIYFAIDHEDSAHLELVHVTVAGNRRAVGLSSTFSPPSNLVVVDSVIVIGCNAAVVDRGEFVCNSSWTEANLRFGPLDSTGPAGVKYLPLLAGSPLIDAGLICPLSEDVRGSERPRGVTCDVGAYESDYSTAIAPLEFVTPSGGVPGVIPLYTDTPQAPTFVILTFAKNAFCRKGPGTLYKDVTGFKKGDTTQADGRNELDPRWWWVQIPNSTEHCWVSGITVEPNDQAEGLPIGPVAFLELPSAPSGFVINKRVCSQNGYSLKLAWTKSVGADGYTLYRNGIEIATFKSSQTVYQENPPTNKSLRYELEAFNTNGFSERLVVEDSCP